MWGLAWDVKDIEKAHQRLLDEGIEVTAIQKGVKEKTLVATVKSHTQNVPTLLIQAPRLNVIFFIFDLLM